jgi:hypothetical protein
MMHRDISRKFQSLREPASPAEATNSRTKYVKYLRFSFLMSQPEYMESGLYMPRT